MLLNLCTILLSVVLVAMCEDVLTKKYNPDSNRIIKRLHASALAKLFLQGCIAEPYIELNKLNATTKNESNFFELPKSKEYLFAIFTLEKVSLILSNTNGVNVNKNYDDELDYGNEVEGNVAEEDIMVFNITLGLNQNSNASLEVYANGTLVPVTILQTLVPILPTIPYYVNVSITADKISVYEARTGASDPFLTYAFNPSSRLNLTIYKYFAKFRHSSPIYAHYDCCEACTPWIYTRISGCSKYSARTASVETTHLINDDNSQNQTNNVLFNRNILVHHDGSPTFRAKIIFSEIDSPKGNRYEIGLSDNPTILHFVNNSAQVLYPLKTKVTLKQDYISPFIVNITITRDGVVLLRQPYEQNPFLVYVSKKHQLEPVNAKYMTMIKVHEDFIRYDFFHNCTDLLFFKRRNELKILGEVRNESVDVDGTDKYPMIWEYASKRFNTTKYDVLHVFRDSYQIYEKSSQIQTEDSSDYEDKTSGNSKKSGPGSEKPGTDPPSKGGSTISEIIKKGVVGIGSFLFVGILKLICQLEFVKNLMKEADMDEDKAKDLRKSVSNVVNKNIANKLGFDDNDDE